MTNLPVQRDLSPVQMLEGPSIRSRMPEPRGDFGAVLDRTLRDSARDPHPSPANERYAVEARSCDEPSRTSEGLERRGTTDAETRAGRDADAKSTETSSENVSHRTADEGRKTEATSNKAEPTSERPTKAEDDGTVKRSATGKETKVSEPSSGVTGPDGSPQVAVSSKAAKTKGTKVDVKIDAATILAHEKAAAAAKAAAALEAGVRPKIAIEGVEKKPAAGVKVKLTEKGDGTEALAAAILATQVVKGDKAASAADSADVEKKEAARPASKRSDGIQAGQGAAKSTTEPHLVVIDLRGAGHHDAVPPSPESGLQPGGSEPKHQNFEVRLFGIDSGTKVTPDSFARTDSLILPSRQDALNTLQQNWGPLMNQVVKSAGIVMRDNTNGEIRLVLKPEHLGSVRIQLEMKDSLISGKIVVENQSVRQLFQQNLESLYRAFQEGGFATGALNVSVGGNGAGSREKGRYSGLPVTEAMSGLKSLADHIPDLQVIGRAESLVNLIV